MNLRWKAPEPRISRKVNDTETRSLAELVVLAATVEQKTHARLAWASRDRNEYGHRDAATIRAHGTSEVGGGT